MIGELFKLQRKNEQLELELRKEKKRSEVLEKQAKELHDQIVSIQGPAWYFSFDELSAEVKSEVEKVV